MSAEFSSEIGRSMSGGGDAPVLASDCHDAVVAGLLATVSAVPIISPRRSVGAV